MSDKWCPSGVCASCGRYVGRLNLDHIIPRFRGGTHDTSNLQWLCEDCHKRKTSSELSEVARKHTTGRKHSSETKEKIRQGNLGKHSRKK